MNDIDFLPEDYVCVQSKRGSNNCLRALFLAIGVAFAILWGEQKRALIELSDHRNQLQEQARSRVSKLESSNSLKAELDLIESGQRLIDGLRSNTPPSRWLEGIIRVLPSKVVIADLHAEFDDGSEPHAQSAMTNASDFPRSDFLQSGKTVPALKSDLRRLMTESRKRSAMISICGTADDDLEVSRLLNGLQQNELFQRVQLLFTDQQFHEGRSVRSFAVRLKTQSLADRILRRKPESRGPRNVAINPTDSKSTNRQDH